MKKALIMCNAAMSSSLMAKKTTEYMQAKGYDIQIDATTADAGIQKIKEDRYDLYLVSPQMRHRYDILKTEADKVNKPIALISFQAYAPIPLGFQKLSEIVLSEIDL